MAMLQIVRGTAELPSDFERKFQQAAGRELTLEERRFLGIEPDTSSASPEVEREQYPVAA